MEENKKYLQMIHTLVGSGFIFITIVAVGLATYIYGVGTTQLIRNIVLAIIGAGSSVFVFMQAITLNQLSHHNEEHPIRFLIIYIISLFFALAFPVLPAAGWPYVVIFIMLSLFSNTLCGIVCSSSLLMISCLLSQEASPNIFFLYFICGCVCAIIFSTLDENYKFGLPMLISGMIIILCETANVVLFVNETLNFEVFLIPMMNVVVSLVLILILLKLFGNFVVFHYRDKYLYINDTECPLLVELKSKFPEEYFHAVHVAYLSDKIALALNMDRDVVKTASYYQRIGVLRGENTSENRKNVLEEYEFPPQTIALISEINTQSKQPFTKEAATVLMADTIVSSITFIFAKNPTSKVDYEQIIETVFHKKEETGMFLNCNITMKEIAQLHKIFLEETLYYDFLR